MQSLYWLLKLLSSGKQEFNVINISHYTCMVVVYLVYNIKDVLLNYFKKMQAIKSKVYFIAVFDY